jgi:hypothetical protein
MQGRVNEKTGGLIQHFSVSYKLKVTRVLDNIGIRGGPLTFFEQVLEIQSIYIDKSSPKLMSIQLNDAIKEMFDTAQPGDSFDVKVIVTYELPNSNIESYEISYPHNPYVYVPKRAII